MLQLLNEWTDALVEVRHASPSTSSNSVKFLGGKSVSMADLMVFGILRGLHGLPTHDFVMSENVLLQDWYSSMSKVLDERRVTNLGS